MIVSAITKKTIFVTGASTGIGYYCAKALQADGYRVIASCRKTEDVQRLRDQGLTCIQLDLADSASVQAGAQQALALCDGKLYGLFNNGAYGQPGLVEDLSRDNLRRQFETNVFGWQELTNLLLPAMFAQGEGRIVQNSSILGFIAMPFRGAYNASKYALEGLTDTLRLELTGTNVHVSLIEPGPITSAFRRNALLALQTNVDSSRTRLPHIYDRALQRLSNPGPNSRFTLGPEAVYPKLKHALEARRPRARYYVTFPTYLMGYLKRALSSRMMDRVLLRAGG